MPWGPGENLTLSEAELAACRPVPGEGGRVLRAFCPFHGSDHQRSLRVNLDTGRFYCFACGSWGYLAERRRSYQDGPRSLRAVGGIAKRIGAPKNAPSEPPGGSGGHPGGRLDLGVLLAEMQKALPGSPGEAYLRRRGIPLEVARACGVGYAAPGRWPHRGRDWRWGRVVFPHTDPAGCVVNLYGRAVGPDEAVPKELRHDHLPGAKGVFNAAALRGEAVFVCEGVFDALSLMAAGHPNAVAIFGVEGLRWLWFRNVRRVVFALDADQRGREAWRRLAWEAVLRGKQVFYVPEHVYRGCKDLNEVWVKHGCLDVGAAPV